MKRRPYVLLSTTAGFLALVSIADGLPPGLRGLDALVAGTLGLISIFSTWITVRSSRLATARPPSEAVESAAVVAQSAFLLSIYFLRAGLFSLGLVLLAGAVGIGLFAVVVWLTRLELPPWISKPPS